MRSFMSTALAACTLASSVCATLMPMPVDTRSPQHFIKPKVFIISMFDPEEEVWHGIPEFDVTAMNFTVPGFSPLFPNALCTADGDICQLVTGEGEINAATTITSLVRSNKFDLTTTYFLIAGIAGVNPEHATINSVTFARYAVQVALQYEFSQFEIPTNFSTGYIPLGTHDPAAYPEAIYGTEVFEVNQNLQRLAADFARNATLNDSADAEAYRALYAPNPAYAAALEKPSVIECDTATTDVYYSGTILGETFGNFTTLITNGTGVYCTSAQEDNATLEALLRAAMDSLVDFSRIIVMRSASDFERPWPGSAATTNLFWSEQGAFRPSVDNLYLAGIKVVEGILEGWESTFAKGVKADNYVGDIFDSLKGDIKPDFGPAAYDNYHAKRSLKGMRNMAGKGV